MVLFECPFCHGALDIAYDYKKIKNAIKKSSFKKQPVSHWKYAAFFPVNPANAVSLGEGNTPLVESRRNGFFFKLEGCNPTGSFKDRGSAVEITKARELGVKEVACASTGNMGASVAAFAARAGMKARIFVPKIAARQKILQMLAHGAIVERVNGDYTAALLKTKSLREKRHVYLTGDYPFRGEGEKSIGFEIAEQFCWKPPENIVCPVGNGTLIYSVFKAFAELKAVGLVEKTPRVFGIQAERCMPIAKAFREKADFIVPVKNPKTVATAIACGAPVDWRMALHAIRSSKGSADAVSEREIIAAKKELGFEGIFAEFSGAVALAGAKNLGLRGKTVLLVTGHGLKDG
jgi:threonine synthase